MAYSDEGVKAKLSSLNETQESIVTVAQWIMFHRRYAGRTAQLWIQRLKESNPNKRLNLIYLANEVVQQSKARRKDDFLQAFSPMIADATGWAYKGASPDVQAKLRRAIEVWRQRNIFDQATQEAVEAKVELLDKDRSNTGKRPLGGALFSSSSSTPTELQGLVNLQNTLSKAELTVKPTATTANTEYETLMDDSKPTPSPPVHAARLSALLKSLANAESAVSESIKARKALIEGLEALLKTNTAALAEEESQHQDLTAKRPTVEAKKREVEDSIMRGLTAEDAESTPTTVNGATAEEPNFSRPDIEALTPPPVESFTPPETPPAAAPEIGTGPISGDPVKDAEAFLQSLPGPGVMASEPSELKSFENHPKPFTTAYGANGNGVSGLSGTAKRRKMSHGVGDEEFPAFGNGEDAMDGLDDDVKGMLGTE